MPEEEFQDYLEDIAEQAERARKQYGMLVVPGVEVTQNHLKARKNSHIIALGVTDYISADQKADEILREIRRQDALSIACHPHHRTTRRIEISTCYLWDNRKTLADLVDVWEAANRDDLFSVTSLKHYPVRRQQRLPQAEAPLLVEDAAAVRQDVAVGESGAQSERRRRADVVSQRRTRCEQRVSVGI